MTYKNYKELAIDKLEYDIHEAACQVAWYKYEMRNHKYNAVQDAIKSHEIWEERLASLKRKRKQLDDMFTIYESKD